MQLDKFSKRQKEFLHSQPYFPPAYLSSGCVCACCHRNSKVHRYHNTPLQVLRSLQLLLRNNHQTMLVIKQGCTV